MTFSAMWILCVFLAVSGTVMLTTHILSITGVLSSTISKTVADILGYVWVLTGLTGIILIYCTESNPNNISNDQTPAQEDTTAKQWTVTGTAQQINSSFTMDLHLSETKDILKPLPGTQTGIQQQLSKDV